MKQKPTVERLREVFTLDSDTGELFWRVKIADKVVVGAKAGSKRADGYVRVQVDKVRLLVHQVVFALTHGDWAGCELDHANGNPSDNSPKNLRKADRFKNNYNRRVAKHNTSGTKGVFKQKQGICWNARLTTNGVLKRIGGFRTKEQASEFLDLWRAMAHGDFANDGNLA